MASPSDAQLLDIYRNAMAAVATGQSYTINGRSMTRADLAKIQSAITWLEGRIDAAAAVVAVTSGTTTDTSAITQTAQVAF